MAQAKTAGIIGGISPESTVEYYRLIVQGYRARTGDGSYPRVLINSIDMTAMLGMVRGGRTGDLTAYLASAVKELASAGADFAAFASNTPHIVFDEVSSVSTIPLVSIVEAACAEVSAGGIGRVALMGTGFTMGGDFYQRVFSGAGITIALPLEHERKYIDNSIFSELVAGSFREETRMALEKIAQRMVRDDAVRGIILGCTELPLILKDENAVGVPFFDTTRIHVRRIIECMAAA
jgi:aspartate racemase